MFKVTNFASDLGFTFPEVVIVADNVHIAASNEQRLDLNVQENGDIYAESSRPRTYITCNMKAYASEEAVAVGTRPIQIVAYPNPSYSAEVEGSYEHAETLTSVSFEVQQILTVEEALEACYNKFAELSDLELTPLTQ